MKKISIILCMMAALMLVFTASAENAQLAADAVYTADFEQLLPLLGEVDEDVANMLVILGKVMERTSGHMAIGEKRYESTYWIDNETLLNYSYADMSNGIEFYSSSCPSYVFRVTNEELEEIVALLSSLPEAVSALLEQIDLTVYSDMLGEFLASIGTESSECSEMINDVLYTGKTVITVSGEQTKAFALKALEQLAKDLEKLGLPMDTGSVMPEDMKIGDVGAVLYTSDDGIIRAEVSGEAFGEGIVAVIYPDGAVYAYVNNAVLAFEAIENGYQFTLSEGETTVQMTEVMNGNESDILFAILNGENLIEMENASVISEEGVETCFAVRVNGAQLIRFEAESNVGYEDAFTSMKMYIMGAEKAFYGMDMKMYASEEEMAGYTAPENAVVITLADLMNLENLSSIASSLLMDCLVGMFTELTIFADAEPALAPIIEELAGVLGNVAVN